MSPKRSGAGIALQAMLLFLLASLLPTLLTYAVEARQGWKAGSILSAFPWAVDTYRFFDLLDYEPRFLYLHTDRFFATSGFPWAWYAFVYPPFGAVFCRALFVFSPHAALAYVLSALSGLVAAAVWYASALGRYFEERWKAYGFVALLLLTSFPALFMLMRGNIEIFGFLLVAAAVWAYWTERWKTCAVLLGAAAAFKLFPILLAALLLAKRRYREVLLSALSFLIIEVISILYMGPTVAKVLAGFVYGLHFHRDEYSLRLRIDNRWDHSIFGFFKLVVRLLKGRPEPLQPSTLIAYLCIAAVAGLIFYWIRLRKLPRLNQIVVLLTLSILLPPTSFLYTLLYLYVAFAAILIFLLRYRPAIENQRGIFTSIMLFGLACADWDFLGLKRTGFGGCVQCLCLTAVVVIAAKHPWKEVEAATPALT